MAQAPAPIGIAPRYQKPPMFGGTDVAWRVLCDLYPAAETPEIILAVVEYCAARHLDPLRKPVHVVPMYNAKLKRRVQVVMQGINELETTAHRTKAFAGADEADYGPDETKTFRGTQEDERGNERSVEVKLTYPVSAAVKVYRIVQGEKRAFSERVFFLECYGRAGFRSEVPNARWTLAPRQMLAKVAKAASLRLAFPEEGLGYAAEEMEGREVETGGVTIEGRVDHGDPGLTERDRRIERKPPSQPPGEARTGIELLDDDNGDRWMKALLGLLRAAATLADVEAIQQHRSVVATLDPKAKTPKLIRETIVDEFQRAHDRIVADAQERAEADVENLDEPPADWPDPVGELIAEIETMDLVALNGLASSAQWRARVREAAAFPPDEDRVNEAIAARKATLQPGRTGQG